MSHPGQDVTADRLDTPPRVPAGTAGALGAASLVLVVLGIAGWRTDLVSPPSLALAALLWAGVVVAVSLGRHAHPHRRFGAANVVTTFRATIAVAIAALAVQAGAPVDGAGAAVTLAGSTIDVTGGATGGTADELSASAVLWGVTVAAIVALALDGVDGPLARASGLESAFGARYDMEIDALLALVLAALIWRTGELGAWVLALGTMRYLFVAAAWLVPALNAPLFPAFRRKLVCVVQIAALCAIVAPLVAPPLAVVVGAAATLALVYSFARDTLWLLRRDADTA